MKSRIVSEDPDDLVVLSREENNKIRYELKMNLVITPREAFEKGIWDELCALHGLSIWCVKEGLMGLDEIIYLTAEEAHKLGVV